MAQRKIFFLHFFCLFLVECIFFEIFVYFQWLKIEFLMVDNINVRLALRNNKVFHDDRSGEYD